MKTDIFYTVGYLMDFLILESSKPTVVRSTTCFVGWRWILLRRGVSCFAHDGEDRGSVLLWRHCLVRTRSLSRQPLQPLLSTHYSPAPTAFIIASTIHYLRVDCRTSIEALDLPKQDGGCNQTLSPLATNKLIKPHPPPLQQLKDR